MDSVEPLRASVGDAETGHHLIQDQQRSVARGDIAQRFEKSRLRRNAAHIAHHRFHDHAGDLAAMLAKRLFQRIGRIERQGHRGVAKTLRDAGRIRQAECRDA